MPAPTTPPGSDDDRGPPADGEPPTTNGAPRGTGADDSNPSILESVAARTGQSPKVHLADEGSTHGASPVIDASSPAARGRPAGREHYQVLGEIARGAMGVILKSHDTDLGRDVAMKVLLEEHADSEAILQRFVEEAQIGGQLQHPGIVPVYDMGLMADERPFFTMKLIKGRTLAKLLASRKDLAEDRHRFLGVFEKACETMAYAHARRVIHRDLKPANIMVGAFGEVQVVDWGLAKVLTEGGIEDERAAAATDTTRLSIIETVRSVGSTAGTQSIAGSVMGTPAYMPPEQARGKVELLDERADVFTLGAILCEILTGRPPYVGEHDRVVIEAADALQDGARQRLAECGADTELVQLALECLAPSRSRRPADAAAVVERVQTYLATQEERRRAAEVAAAEAAVRATQERKARLLTALLAVTIVLAALGGGAGYLHIEQRDADRQDQTVREVDRLLEEAGVLRERGDFDGALVACARADAVLAAAEPDPELSARVERATDRAEAGAEGVRREQERAALVATFVQELDEIVFGQAFHLAGRVVEEWRSGRFVRAFAEVGIDPFAPDVDATVAAIREVGAAAPVVFALDEWARLTRSLQGFRSRSARQLSDLADALDEDPVRARIRAATLEDDQAGLLEITGETGAADWPPTTVLMLYFALQDVGFASRVEPVLRECQRRHPTHPGINQLLARHLRNQSPWPGDEVIRFLSAARAATSENAVPTRNLVYALARAGRLDESIATYLAGIRQNPETQWLAGGTTLDAVLAPFDEADRRRISKLTSETYLSAAPETPDRLNGAAWFLLATSDPARRDPARALALIERALAELPDEADYWNTQGVAQYLLGRWQDAITSMESSIRLSGTADTSDLLVIAIALDELGQPDAGRAWYERALPMRPTPGTGNRLMGETDFLWDEGARRFASGG